MPVLARSRAVLAVLALAAVCLAAPSPARAEAWTIKKFQVVNVEPSGDVEALGGLGNLPELIVRAIREAGPVDPDFPGVFETVEMDPETAWAIERFLNESAELFESWDFAEPALQPVVETGNGERAYRVYLVDRFDDQTLPEDAWAGIYKGSCNDFEERVILLDASSLLEGGRLTPKGAQTAAHELFHAVQGASPFFECRTGEGEAGDWIHEGQARAVGWDAFHILRGVRATAWSDEQWGARSYELELSVADNTQDEYLTSSFWRYLAEASVIASPGPGVNAVDYSFLARLYQSPSVGRGCNGSNADCDAELRWLDANLRNLFAAPLRQIYARFLQALVEYGDHRPGLSHEGWRVSVLTGCQKIVLGLGENETQVVLHEMEYFTENAAACFEVELRGLSGNARLAVRVDDPDGKFKLEDLTAGLGGLPIQTFRAQVEEGGTARTAAWSFAIDGDGSTYVLLSNLADEPDRTTKLDGLPVTFTLQEEWALMGPHQSAVSLPSTVFAPVPLELDRLRHKFLVPALTEQQAAAGFTAPCALRFYFTNSGTGDAVGIELDVERPLLPDTYNVALLDEGRYEPPEENAGLVVATFDMGRGNPLSQGDRRGLGGQTGTLQLDVVSADLVQGKLQVLGKRAIDGKWEAGGWRDFPDELETLAIETSFSLVPESPARRHLSLAGCIAAEPERRIGPKKKKKQEKPKPKPDPENGDGQTGAGSGANPPPAPDDPAEETDVAAAPDQAASQPAGSVVPVECGRLLYQRSVVFDADPDLPFRFRHPDGWQYHADGRMVGRIAPPDDGDAGVQYRANELSNPRQAAKARSLQAAMWEKIATIDYGGQPLDIYGGNLGDVAHAYFVAPHGEGFVDAEVLFKGRRACDIALVEELRELFVSSLAPTS